MRTMATMAVEQVHQGASQQQQVYPVAGPMIPMLANQIEPDDQGNHPDGTFERAVVAPLVAMIRTVRLRC